MILFLDFDGVLHPLERPNGTFTNLPRFEQVMRDYPAVEMVVSSAWREEHPLDALRSFFAPDIANRSIGITPVFEFLDHSYVRQAEILAWLQDSNRENEEWVALDDSDWLFAPNSSNLILVDADTGFDTKAEQQIRDYIESISKRLHDTSTHKHVP